MPAGPLDPRWADNANCGSCDAEALSNMRYGLWGGLTERERRQLLRAVPEQADWYESITSSPDPVFVAIREGKPLRLSRRNAQKKEGERKGDEDDE